MSRADKQYIDWIRGLGNEDLRKGFLEGYSRAIADNREQIANLEADCRKLADAVLGAEGYLRNDLYSSRVNNALAVLDDARDEAINWMSEPND